MELRCLCFTITNSSVESLSTSMVFDDAKLDISSSTSLQSSSRPHGPTPNVGLEHSPTLDSERKVSYLSSL